eukprot:gene15043-17797_t
MTVTFLNNDPTNQPFLTQTWDQSIDAALLAQLKQSASIPYNFDNIKDLIRCMRNTIQHHQDIFIANKQQYFSTPLAVLTYFEKQHPNLLLYLYQKLRSHPEITRQSIYLKDFIK